jgi:hypothetical protein
MARREPWVPSSLRAVDAVASRSTAQPRLRLHTRFCPACFTQPQIFSLNLSLLPRGLWEPQNP